MFERDGRTLTVEVPRGLSHPDRALVWPLAVLVSLFLPWATTATVTLPGAMFPTGWLMAVLAVALIVSWRRTTGQRRRRVWAGLGVALTVVVVYTAGTLTEVTRAHYRALTWSETATFIHPEPGSGCLLAFAASVAALVTAWYLDGGQP